MTGPSNAAVEAAKWAILEARHPDAPAGQPFISDMDMAILTDEVRAALKAAFPLIASGVVDLLADYVDAVNADGNLPHGQGSGAWAAAPDALQDILCCHQHHSEALVTWLRGALEGPGMPS